MIISRRVFRPFHTASRTTWTSRSPRGCGERPGRTPISSGVYIHAHAMPCSGRVDHHTAVDRDGVRHLAWLYTSAPSKKHKGAVVSLPFCSDLPVPYIQDNTVIYARRFAPRAAYVARHARSGRKSTSHYTKRADVHD